MGRRWERKEHRPRDLRLTGGLKNPREGWERPRNRGNTEKRVKGENEGGGGKKKNRPPIVLKSKGILNITNSPLRRSHSGGRKEEGGKWGIWGKEKR